MTLHDHRMITVTFISFTDRSLQIEYYFNNLFANVPWNGWCSIDILLEEGRYMLSWSAIGTAPFQIICQMPVLFALLFSWSHWQWNACGDNRDWGGNKHAVNRDTAHIMIHYNTRNNKIKGVRIHTEWEIWQTENKMSVFFLVSAIIIFHITFILCVRHVLFVLYRFSCIKIYIYTIYKHFPDVFADFVWFINRARGEWTIGAICVCITVSTRAYSRLSLSLYLILCMWYNVLCHEIIRVCGKRTYFGKWMRAACTITFDTQNFFVFTVSLYQKVSSANQ